MKKIILGFILGAMLATSITTYAAIELNIIDNPYPIIVNGIKKNVKAFNINGTTYINLRDVVGVTGSSVNFNSDKEQIEINLLRVKEPEPTPTPSQKIYKVGDIIELQNCKAKVNSIRYDTKIDEFGSGSRIFAIVNLDIFINQKPENKYEWSTLDFVKTFKLDTGDIINTSLSPGESAYIKLNTWHNTNAVVRIEKQLKAVSVFVSDPISGDVAEVVF